METKRKLRRENRELLDDIRVLEGDLAERTKERDRAHDELKRVAVENGRLRATVDPGPAARIDSLQRMVERHIREKRTLGGQIEALRARLKAAGIEPQDHPGTGTAPQDSDAEAPYGADLSGRSEDDLRRDLAQALRDLRRARETIGVLENREARRRAADMAADRAAGPARLDPVPPFGTPPAAPTPMLLARKGTAS